MPGYLQLVNGNNKCLVPMNNSTKSHVQLIAVKCNSKIVSQFWRERVGDNPPPAVDFVNQKSQMAIAVVNNKRAGPVYQLSWNDTGDPEEFWHWA